MRHTHKLFHIMKIFKYENGFSKRDVELKLVYNRFQQFVHVSENEYYELSHVYNDSKKDCYKIVTRLEDGKKFNVNMNNGIAYYTNLD